MLAEIITIGDELLIGQIINTNTAYIAQQLNLTGIKVGRFVSVADTKLEIIAALTEAMQRANIVIITGGLGPTSDDITKPAICEFLECGLINNAEVYEHVEKLLSDRGIGMNDLNKSQAQLPQKCKVMPNMLGTAPGLLFEKNNCTFFALPGVPFEMEGLMQHHVIPIIKAKFNTPIIYHQTAIAIGVAESILAEKIKNWENNLPANIKLAYLPSPGIVKLRLSATGNSYSKLQNDVNEQFKKLMEIVGEYFYTINNQSVEELLVELLKRNKKSVTVAESCTGGNISRLITSVPGSSEIYLGGVIAYSNSIKTNFLNVGVELLSNYGAVSEQVIETMAINCCKQYGSNYAIASSGIAGPTGGTPNKPVGTVWLAVSNGKSVVSQCFSFGNIREHNITKASVMALNMLRKFIEAENQ